MPLGQLLTTRQPGITHQVFVRCEDNKITFEGLPGIAANPIVFSTDQAAQRVALETIKTNFDLIFQQILNGNNILIQVPPIAADRYQAEWKLYLEQKRFLEDFVRDIQAAQTAEAKRDLILRTAQNRRCNLIVPDWIIVPAQPNPPPVQPNPQPGNPLIQAQAAPINLQNADIQEINQIFARAQFNPSHVPNQANILQYNHATDGSKKITIIVGQSVKGTSSIYTQQELEAMIRAALKAGLNRPLQFTNDNADQLNLMKAAATVVGLRENDANGYTAILQQAPAPAQQSVVRPF